MADHTLEQAARDVLVAYDALGTDGAAFTVRLMAYEAISETADFAGVTRMHRALNSLRKILPEPGKNPTGGDLPHSGAIKLMDLWAQASPASNAASDARDLSMVLVRALGAHDLGFRRDELAALHTVAGMVKEHITEAADRAEAVCGLIEPAGGAETGSVAA